MSYSTNTTILILLPGLPQTTTSAGYTATLAIVDRNITKADSLINGKISGRYDVTNFVSLVPPLLVSLSEDIASYYTFRSLYSGDNQNYSEYIDKYKEAIDILDQIRKDELDLVDSTGNQIDEKTETDQALCSSNTMDWQPFFDEDNPIDWKNDTDKNSSILENR